VGTIFLAEISCDQEGCESRLTIFVPTTTPMTAEWLTTYSKNCARPREPASRSADI
jgi:hypothetical protein